MKKSKFIFLVFTISFLICCNGGSSLHYEFDFGKELLWTKPITWKWNIQKNDKPYRLTMDIQCGIHYPYENLPLSWTEIKPNGDSITHELDIVIRNPDGTYNGDKAMDYLNFDVVLAEQMEFESFGEYQFILQQKTGLDSAPFMVNVEIEAIELNDY
jgi:gliding motility-associated lipoprotein GldH